MSVEQTMTPDQPLEVKTPPNNEPVKPNAPSQEEIQQLLNKEREKVRKEEKDKLYPELEKLRKAAEDKDAALTELQKKFKDLESTNLTAEEKLNLKVQEFQKSLEDITKAAETEQRSLLSTIQKEKLDSYREKKLAELRDIVDNPEDFITGSSPEEIDASVEKARRLAVTLAAKLGIEIETRLKNDLKVPSPQAPQVNQTSETKLNAFDYGHSDWAKVRDEVKRKALEGLKG